MTTAYNQSNWPAGSQINRDRLVSQILNIMDFRKKKEINNGTVLQNRAKIILSKVVPH